MRRTRLASAGEPEAGKNQGGAAAAPRGGVDWQDAPGARLADAVGSRLSKVNGLVSGPNQCNSLFLLAYIP